MSKRHNQSKINILIKESPQYCCARKELRDFTGKTDDRMKIVVTLAL